MPNDVRELTRAARHLSKMLEKLPADSPLPVTDMVYAPLFEGPDDGREVFGWYLGLAVRNKPGYHQLKPGFGPYRDEGAAREHSRALNEKLGHDEKSALLVILSSMSGPGAIRR
jgi:hypothetical protein